MADEKTNTTENSAGKKAYEIQTKQIKSGVRESYTGNALEHQQATQAEIDDFTNELNKTQLEFTKNTTDEDDVAAKGDLLNPENVEASVGKYSSALAPDAEAPEVPKTQEQRSELREEYDVATYEDELNDLLATRRDMLAIREGRVQNQYDRKATMGVISGSLTRVEREEAEKLSKIDRDIARTQDILKTKYSIIDQIITDTQTDYKNATDKYNTEFNRNLSLMNYLQGLDNSAKDDEQRASDDARANLQIIYNNLQSGDLKLEDLDPAKQMLISKLESQAGLPSGTFQALKKKEPLMDIVSTTSRQTSDGSEYIDFIMRDPDTGDLKLESVYKGKGTVKSGSGGGSSTKDEDKALVSFKKEISDFRYEIDTEDPTDEEIEAMVRKIARDYSDYGVTENDVRSALGLDKKKGVFQATVDFMKDTKNS